MNKVVIIGAGLAGMVCARELAEKGYAVIIYERRNHVGGNIYDKVNEDGFLIQMYGPHCFYTDDEQIRPYIEKFTKTTDCYVRCKTVIDGKAIPMPFNYESISMIYDEDKAKELIERLENNFAGREIVSVTELIGSEDEMISGYGKYMYQNEYRKYTAKQWDQEIESISPEVFHRVPVYLSRRNTYQSVKSQFLPVGGFSYLAKNMMDHPNIKVCLEEDAFDKAVCVEKNWIRINEMGSKDIPVIFTGELDALFGYKFGKLPYRSLEFIWKNLDQDEYQDTEIVAYPQADKITRITEYKKLPPQEMPGKTVISIEIPVTYDRTAPIGNEPYYPIKNKENDELYNCYLKEAEKIKNLYLCGRLAEFKYYNMDAVIRRAWEVSGEVEARML